jgi:hypothetical protein
MAESARAETLKPRMQRWLEYVQLRTRCFFTQKEYVIYRFGERGKNYRHMLNFLTARAYFTEFRPAVNEAGWKPLLDNKWLFHTHFKPLGIPVTDVYAVYYPGMGITRDGEPFGTFDDVMAFLRRVRPRSLVIKPVGGIMGQHMLILDEVRYEGSEITFVDNTGKTLTTNAIAALLERHPGVHYFTQGYELFLNGYLLEAKLLQHPFLAELAPWTTNTVRMVTFLNHRSEVELHVAILRLGRRGSTGDNWDRGGLSVHVNIETGALGRGVLKPKYGGTWTDTHPDTNVRFTSRQLPFWREVCDVCTRAARLTPGLRSVGWDVVITAQGPVIIEGNPDWDLHMVQVHTDGYLQPAIRSELAHYGLRFPEGSLPAFSAAAWWRYRQDEKLRKRKIRSTKAIRMSWDAKAKPPAARGGEQRGMDGAAR